MGFSGKDSSLGLLTTFGLGSALVDKIGPEPGKAAASPVKAAVPPPPTTDPTATPKTTSTLSAPGDEEAEKGLLSTKAAPPSDRKQLLGL